MKKIVSLACLAVALLSLGAGPSSTADHLRELRTGVWLNEAGVYTVWTDEHYFVVSASGEGKSTNIYCGASRIRFTDKGIARKQDVRLRQMGETAPTFFTDREAFQKKDGSALEEAPLQIDMDLFDPDHCVIDKGVIYDSIAEETDDYILLSTCNGDREKIFADGRACYLPAGGGEFWSYRVEEID